MGAQWTKQSGSAQIRQRIDALVQPMPDHEVEPVDFDTTVGMGRVSAKAVIAMVAVLAMAGAVLFGCSMQSESPVGSSPQNSLGGAPGEASALPGQMAATDVPAESSASVSATDAASANSQTDDPEVPLVVSVQGKVPRPGLLEVPANTRVGQAIEQAGGGLAGARLHHINLAEKVVDGMQILVDAQGSAVTYPGGLAAGGSAGGSSGAGAPGAGTGAPTGGGGGAGSGATGDAANAKININTADSTALETLDGVGPATATAIITWRESNGAFTSIEQLMEVRGIGPAKFEAMKDHVTV